MRDLILLQNYSLIQFCYFKLYRINSINFKSPGRFRYLIFVIKIHCKSGRFKIYKCAWAFFVNPTLEFSHLFRPFNHDVYEEMQYWNKDLFLDSIVWLFLPLELLLRQLLSLTLDTHISHIERGAKEEIDTNSIELNEEENEIVLHFIFLGCNIEWVSKFGKKFN